MQSILQSSTPSPDRASPKEAESTTFLVPCASTFPFDVVCEQIVLVLRFFQWRAPDTSVTFRRYGSIVRYEQVDDISGADYRLRFGRRQETLEGGVKNASAVLDVTVPRLRIHVAGEYDRPVSLLYVGTRWQQDRQAFMDAPLGEHRTDHPPRGAILLYGSMDTLHAAASELHRIHERLRDMPIAALSCLAHRG